jgi:hypothetical protein
MVASNISFFLTCMNILKYRKKPVVVEALLWDGTPRPMFNFLSEYENPDEKYIEGDGKNFYIDHSKVKGGLVIKTLEGEHIASLGDYIIKGVSGACISLVPKSLHDLLVPKSLHAF